MSANQYYAYIDESGNFDVKNNDNMLVISAIVTSDPIVLARSMRTAEKYAELRAADFIVYETYQKYKFGSELYDIISNQVKYESIYKNTYWEEIKKESKTPSYKSP